MKINNLLITAIGGDIAQSVTKIIKQNRPDIKIIGVDMNTRHAGMVFVDEFIQIPAANHLEYLPTLKELIKKFKVDILLPMSEIEISICADMDNQLENSLILYCGKKGLDIGLDKLKTNQFLQSINAPYPWTEVVADAKYIKLPCILKPKTGSGSKGVYRVENQLDFDYFKQKYPNYIFQELLTPSTQEITCAIYRTKTGETHVLQMLRQLIGDATGWAVVINRPHINQLCIKIANELNIKGSINVQLINNEDGAYIFEINPRISSTVAMRNAIGFQDVIWMLDEIEEKQISVPVIKNKKIMLKTCDVVVLDNLESEIL
jgi:carbamoyl-phosphate synthase large subunit